MSSGKDDLLRWRETAHDPRALGARAADLVDAVRDVAPLPPEALARIKASVVARHPSRVGRTPFVLRAAVLAAIVLMSVATAQGTMVLWRRHVEATAAAEAAKVRPPVAPRPRPPAVKVQAVKPVAPPPVVEPAPIVETPPPARPAPARRTAMAAPAPARATSDAGSEAQLLAGALARLRQAHDPAGALGLLDQYARTYPRGILRSEALSARLEAVIALDDRKTALGLLDGQRTFDGRVGGQLLLTRAELRASAGRYTDALVDFDLLLAGPGPAAATDAERALYGRAVCLGHLGRDDRARADLLVYQRRFPDGKHAAEVARLLGGGESLKRP